MSRKIVLWLVAAVGAAACVFLIAVMAVQGLARAGAWAGPLAALAGIVAAVAAVWALWPRQLKAVGLNSLIRVYEPYRDKVREGFRATNGPDAITISNVWLQIQYSYFRPKETQRYKIFVCRLRSTSFECLGIAGPTTPLRLRPGGEESWMLPPYVRRFPRTVTIGEESFDQHIELRLIVEASGRTISSNRVLIGIQHQRVNFGFKDITIMEDDNSRLVEVLERITEPTGEGKPWIGFYEWLVSLIRDTAAGIYR